MSKVPMPSPNGTNHAGLFLPSGSRAAVAYDAMPDAESDADKKFSEIAQGVLEFLSDKLDPADLKKAAYLLGQGDDAGAEDRRRRTFRGASDASRRVTPPPIAYTPDNFPHMNRQKF